MSLADLPSAGEVHNVSARDTLCVCVCVELLCVSDGLCLNGGTCHENFTMDTFHCSCPSQFTGPLCEHGLHTARTVGYTLQQTSSSLHSDFNIIVTGVNR